MREPEAMDELELVAVFLTNNKMQEMLRYCREINPEKNGVVTISELDDILKILYPDELENRDLSNIYETYCNPSNKILIDYKAFRDMLNSKLKTIETNFSLPTSAMTTQKHTPAAK